MSRGEDSPLLCAIIMLTVKMSGIFTAESPCLNRRAVTEEALAHCKNGFYYMLIWRAPSLSARNGAAIIHFMT